MKIIKYLFLIALLLTIGLSVFVSTQSAQFEIERSKIIKTPRTAIYNYVHNLNNWDSFIAAGDTLKKGTVTSLLAGKSAKITYLYKNNKTAYQTIATSINQSIALLKVTNGAKSVVTWVFKDTLGGTKVTVKSKGSVDFETKINSFFKGGVATIAGNETEFNLENLNKILHLEIDSFAITLNEIVTQDSTLYVKRDLTCYETDVVKNVKIVLPQLQKYCESKNAMPAGKSFIGIEKTSPTSKVVKLSVFYPVKDSVSTSPTGVYLFGLLEKCKGIKGTLKGNYSNIEKLKEALAAETLKNKININKNGNYFEIYKISELETKRKSTCITEILIPLAPNKPKYSKVKRPPGDTTREPGDAKPTDVNLILEPESTPKQN